MNVYSAISIVDGITVEHLWESETDEKAEEFASSQGWELVMVPEFEIEFIPDMGDGKLH